MKVLLLSRKRTRDIGGLARYVQDIRSLFPHITTTNPFSDFSLIHATDMTLLPFGVLLKFIKRKPLIVTAHGLDITYPNWLYQKILYLFVPFADRVVVVSEPTERLLQRFSIDPQAIPVIPSAIILDHLSQQSPIRLPSDNKTLLLTVGNLVPRKGHVWFIKNVIVRLPTSFHYVIVGEGPERFNIERSIYDLALSDRVILAGALTDPQLAYLYHHTDIYVTPNIHIQGDFEGFGIAAGEAAAMGLPVIARAVDGIPSVIHSGKNGILVQSEQSFIRAILKLRDMKLRRALGQKAKKYTRQQFSPEKMKKEYLTLYRQLSGKM